VTRAAQSTRPGAEPRTGVRTFVSSCDPQHTTAAQFAEIIRKHWGIENKNHWKRDALWGEDRPRHRQPKIAQTLALLRGAILALIRQPGPPLFAQNQRNPRAALRLISSPLPPN